MPMSANADAVCHLRTRQRVDCFDLFAYFILVFGPFAFFAHIVLLS